jgi:hypothetical protein
VTSLVVGMHGGHGEPGFAQQVGQLVELVDLEVELL